MSTSPVISIVVIDSSPVVRAGLAALLDGYDDMKVVAVGGTAAQFTGMDIDVAVIGLAGHGAGTANTTMAGLADHPDLRFVVLTDGNGEVVRTVLTAGVSSCLNLRTTDTHELADAVRAVMERRTIISTELLPALSGLSPARAPALSLTARERDVLELLVEGHSNKAIARRLDLRAGTVGVYVSTILTKLGVTNRTEAAAVTLRGDLLR